MSLQYSLKRIANALEKRNASIEDGARSYWQGVLDTWIILAKSGGSNV